MRDFADLPGYRRFIDVVVGRINARNAKRIDLERACLKPLPPRHKTDYDARQITTHDRLSGGHAVRVTSSGGFVLRKVFCTVPSRLIGHHLTGHVCDDRIDLFAGASFVLTLPRARVTRQGPYRYVFSYHHVIHSLRQKPVALTGLTYRDQLFPRQAFRGLFDRMLEQTSDKQACRMIVDLLWHWPTTVAVAVAVAVAVKLNWRPGSRKTCVRNKYPISQLYMRACPVRCGGLPKVEVRPDALAGSLQQSAVCLDYDARGRTRAAA